MRHALEVTFRQPDWVAGEIDLSRVLGSDQEKMRVAIELARRNVAHGGGPFGALVLDGRTGVIAGAGANWVVEQRSSLLHAEVAAIAFAEARLGTHRLPAHYELIASSEPCVLCLGATVWSGVGRLICGATTRDAEAIGFDEGPRRHDWVAELGCRGIKVTLDVLGDDARRVLSAYRASGGPIY